MVVGLNSLTVMWQRPSAITTSTLIFMPITSNVVLAFMPLFKNLNTYGCGIQKIAFTHEAKVKLHFYIIPKNV